MSENQSMSSRAPLPGEADPHFGTDEQMLAWCERENLTPVKDSRGDWDWQSVWESYLARPTAEDSEPVR